MNEGKDELHENSPAKGFLEVLAQEVTVEEGAVDHGQPHVEQK